MQSALSPLLELPAPREAAAAPHCIGQMHGQNYAEMFVITPIAADMM
jgi:hypothetical protein